MFYVVAELACFCCLQKELLGLLEETRPQAGVHLTMAEGIGLSPPHYKYNNYILLDVIHETYLNNLTKPGHPSLAWLT